MMEVMVTKVMVKLPDGSAEFFEEGQDWLFDDTGLHILKNDEEVLGTFAAWVYVRYVE